jgi:lysophospholipase L1-like esterase
MTAAPRLFKKFVCFGALLLLLVSLFLSFMCGQYYEHLREKKQINFSGSSPNYQLPAQLAKVERIVLLGDSITFLGGQPGGWIDLLRGYLKAMAPDHPFQFINKGIQGETAQDMFERFEDDVLKQKPDLTLITAGTNDLLRSLPKAAFQKSVESMVKKAKEAGLNVMLVSIPLTDEAGTAFMVDEFNAAMKAIAQQEGVPYIDVQTPLATMVRDYRKSTGGRDLMVTVDGVHLSSAGNAAFANTILTELGVSSDARAGVRATRDPLDF